MMREKCTERGEGGEKSGESEKREEGRRGEREGRKGERREGGNEPTKPVREIAFGITPVQYRQESTKKNGL